MGAGHRTGAAILLAPYLALLWIVASAASRGQGFWVFVAGLLALAIAWGYRRRGRLEPLFGLFFITLLAAVTALTFEALLYLRPGILSGRVADVAYTGYHWWRGGIYSLDPHAGPLLRPDVHRWMYWEGHWWHHDTNQAGYRGPAVARADAVFLGDSMIYGHGVENDQTAPARFAALTGMAVANLGQQGTCLLQSLMIFRTKGLRLKPRLVFACSHPTDIEDTTRQYSTASLEAFLDNPREMPLVRPKWQPRPWSPVAFWATHLEIPMRSAGVAGALLRGLRNGTLRPRWPPGRSDPVPPFLPSESELHERFDPTRLGWQVQSEALAEIGRLATASGARVVVFDIGWPEEESRAVEALAHRLGMTYSPAGRAVLRRAQAGEEMYLRGDGHWTPLGCRAIAEGLAKTTRELTSPDLRTARDDPGSRPDP